MRRASFGAQRQSSGSLAALSATELQKFLQRDETAAELLTRTFVEPLRTGVPFIDRRIFVRPCDVLELFGPSGSGKTEVLLQAAVTCMLPKSHEGVEYGGSEGGVVFFDLSGKFRIHRFVQVLKANVRRAQDMHMQNRPHTSVFDWKHQSAEVVKACLQRLRVVRCECSYEFLAALHLAPETFRSMKEEGYPARLLLIDSIDAYYWTDRAARTIPLSCGDFARNGVAPLNLQSVFEAATHCCKGLMEQHRVPMVVSKATITTLEDAVYNDYLPAVWRAFVTHRILLSIVDDTFTCERQHFNPPHLSARWEMPERETVELFKVTCDGLKLVVRQ